jgi:integrase-like protein/chromodomain-containing protein
MTLVHDHPTAGHPGRDETIWQAKGHLTWPGMNHWITQYVKGCATCQQNKILVHRTKTPLYQISTLEDAHPFQQISMDLITGLPRVWGKDAILTIVDHGCSRAAIFLAYATTITGMGIAALYLKNVYPWFGLPKKVIMDRDSQFTSHFGKALATRIGAHQNISTAFHPQMDGLSERKNQWVEQYLQIVTLTSPEEWTNWLSIASAVHNNQRNDTTGLLPNQILWGHEATLVPDNNAPTWNQAANDWIEDMKRNQQTAIFALNKTAGKVPTPSPYRVGDQVWLEATHLCLPYQSTKLAPKHHSPFPIVKVVSPVAFQLRIPMAWNIHDIFHASLLSPYHESLEHRPNYSRPLPDLLEGEEEYKVERIVNHWHFGRMRTLQYLIKWKGYPEADNMWEPADQVHTPDLIAIYHRSNPLQVPHKRAGARKKRTIRSSLVTSQQCSTSPSVPQTTRQPLLGRPLQSHPKGSGGIARPFQALGPSPSKRSNRGSKTIPTLMQGSSETSSEGLGVIPPSDLSSPKSRGGPCPCNPCKTSSGQTKTSTWTSYGSSSTAWDSP